MNTYVVSDMISKENISTWGFGLKTTIAKRLWETRLHSIDNREYGLLSEKLLHAHRFDDETIDLLIIFNDFPCLGNSEML